MCFAQVDGNRTAGFDRRVRDTARGIKDVGLDKRICGADVETRSTGSTMVRHDLIRSQFEINEDNTQQEVRAEFGMDQAAVLGDPSQPGGFGRSAL